MTKSIDWKMKSRFESANSMLSPSPWVIEDDLFVFFGSFDSDTGKAHIDCMKINRDMNNESMSIDYQCTNEHANSNGNLPNSLYRFGNDTHLICAEFGEVEGHKHQLFAHKHKIELVGDKFILAAREDFEFIDYKSSVNHTVAGMSYFQENFFYARGSEWFQTGISEIPITRIYKYDSEFKRESEVSIEFEDYDIAYARPTFVSYNENILYSLSVRNKFGGYGSRLFEIKSGRKSRIEQVFHEGQNKLSEDVLTYQYPFLWNGSLWCTCTIDYRGRRGFQLFSCGMNQ